MLNKISISVGEWEKQRRIYFNEKNNLLKLGFAAFYLNRSNRSGIIPSGGIIGGKGQDGSWKMDVRFNKKALTKRIETVASYANRIIPSNHDCKTVLDRKPRRHAFFYIDPPYYQKGGRLYLNNFSDKDHIRLVKILSAKRPYKWILTYDNCEFIRSLYKGFRLFSFDLNYSLQNKRKGDELLITDKDILLPSQININGRLSTYRPVA